MSTHRKVELMDQTDPCIRLRLRHVPEGPAADYLGVFEQVLNREGYAPESILGQLRLVSDFRAWLRIKNIPLEKLTQECARLYLRYRYRSHHRCRDRHDRPVLRRFIQALQEMQGIEPDTPAAPTAAERWLASYATYLENDLGLSMRTIDSYVLKVRPLLNAHLRTQSMRLDGLTAADAKIVEGAFEEKSSELMLADPIEPAQSSLDATEIPVPAPGVVAQPSEAPIENASNVSGIDKSVLAIAEPRRYRNREHLRFVASKACLVCGRKPSDAHHLRFTQPRAMGRKVNDEFAVPLCRTHHRALHRAGNEQAWWKEAGVDPLKAARRLGRKTRLDQDGADGEINGSFGAAAATQANISR